MHGFRLKAGMTAYRFGGFARTKKKPGIEPGEYYDKSLLRAGIRATGIMTGSAS